MRLARRLPCRATCSRASMRTLCTFSLRHHHPPKLVLFTSLLYTISVDPADTYQQEPRQEPRHPHLRTLPQILLRRIPHLLRFRPRHPHRRQQVLPHKLLERSLALLIYLHALIRHSHRRHQGRRALLRGRQRAVAHQQGCKSERRK